MLSRQHTEQIRQEGRTEALVLPPVLDHQGHLGGLRIVGRLPASDADQLGPVPPVVLGHEREPPAVVDRGEPPSPVRREPLLGREEALVDGVPAEPVEERDEGARRPGGSRGRAPAPRSAARPR